MQGLSDAPDDGQTSQNCKGIKRMMRTISFADLLNTTFEEISNNLGACLGFLAFAVPLGVLPLLAFDTSVPEGEGGLGLIAAGALPITMFLGAILVGMVVQFWFVSAMLRGTLAPDFGQMLPYIGISLLMSLSIAVGFVLLIVPGVILLVRWILVLPLVIDNRVPAMDSFGESWARTEGNGWAIFGTLAILLIGILMLNADKAAQAAERREAVRAQMKQRGDERRNRDRINVD